MTRTTKLNISLTLLAFSAFIVIWAVLRQHTHLPLDPYWRYKGQILADSIASTGHIQPQPKRTQGTAFLGSNFKTNLASPLFTVILARITLVPLVEVRSLPIYYTLLMISQAGVAARLSSSCRVFGLTLLSSLATLYFFFHIADSTHRVALSFLLFYLLVLVILTCNGRRKTVAFTSLSLVFLLSYSTFALASLAFFAGVTAASTLTDRTDLSIHLFLILAAFTVTYFGLLNNWIAGVVLIAAQLLADPTHAADFNLAEVLTNVITGKILSGPITAYLHSASLPTPLQYLSRSMMAGAVLVVVAAGLSRARNLYQTQTLDQQDIILAGVVTQLVADVVVRPIFFKSGGINPLLHAVLFLPIFIATAATVTPSRATSWLVAAHQIVAVAGVLLLLSGVGASALAVTEPDHQLLAVSAEEEATGSWAATYAPPDPIVSGLNGLSAYHTVGGTGSTTLPYESSLTTESAQQQYLDVYYQHPEQTDAKTWLVFDQYLTEGVMNPAALTTRPNRRLNVQLSQSQTWGRVYTANQSGVYVRTTSD